MASSNFVSRGGDKLQAALDKFQIDVKGKVALDVGSSTGGFADCLLQNGAKRVYAVDTAYGEFAWKLRNDPRVVVMERTNILYLDHLPDHTPGESKPTPGVEETEKDVDKVDFITIDAGWTKLESVLSIVKKFLKSDGKIIALLKPHYEAKKEDLVKGVLPPEVAEQVRKEVSERIEKMWFKIEDVMESPILGGAGNKEYFLSLLFLKKD